MRIVAVDPSLTRTGICFMEDGLLEAVWSVTTSPEQHWSGRVRAILDAVMPDTFRPDLFVIEGAMMSSRVGPETMWLHGILRWELAGYGDSTTPIAEVAPATRQKWACGAQKDRDKDAVLLAAGRIWPEVSNNDEADAAWLADIAAHAYGDTTERLGPLYRAEVLAKVAWPWVDGQKPNWQMPTKPKKSKTTEGATS